MGKSYKRRNNNFKKKPYYRQNIVSGFDIPKPHLDEQLIPAAVTQIASDTSEPELRPLRISFENYNEKFCGVNTLSKEQSLGVVRSIKKIGLCSTKIDFLKKDILMTPVLNLNDYSRLYNGFGDDVEIFEHKIDRVSRIFYTVVFPESICRIIAITSNMHFETDKIR